MNWDKKNAEKIFSATTASPIFSSLAIFGATKLIWFLATAVFFWGLLSNHLLPVAVSVFFAWSCQLAVAFLFHRRRPFQQNHERPLMKLKFNTPSFPSGHTTVACSMAAAIFAYDSLWGAIFFVMAASVAFCRVAVGVHYFSDIIGGAILGIGVAVAVTKLLL